MTAFHRPDPDTASLQKLEIPIPCTESWEAMQGDEQVRHCGLCRKNVYNLSSMPREEAAALLAGNTDGSLCVRFYRRSDGTVMTSDCGTSVRVKLHDAMRSLPRMAAGAAGMAGAALVAASVAHAAPAKPARSGHAPQAVQAAAPKEPPPEMVVMGAPPPPSQAVMVVKPSLPPADAPPRDAAAQAGQAPGATAAQERLPSQLETQGSERQRPER